MNLGTPAVRILPRPSRSRSKHGPIMASGVHWSSITPKKAKLWPKMVMVILFHDLTPTKNTSIHRELTGFCFSDFFVSSVGQGDWGPLHRPFRFTSGRSFTSSATFPCSAIVATIWISEGKFCSGFLSKNYALCLSRTRLTSASSNIRSI